MKEASTAMERDPLWANCRWVMAQHLIMARQYEEAVAESHVAMELDARSSSIWHCHLGWALVGLGRRQDGIEVFRQQASAAPANAFPQAWLGWALGLDGQRGEALAILRDLEQRRRESYVGGYLLAMVCLGLDDNDQAISWLQQAIEERDGLMPGIKVWPLFDPLRSDPRFQALLKKMNFPA